MFFAFHFITTILLAQSQYALKKVGKLSDSSQLPYYYSLYTRPLIIINTTVYIPDDRCIELRNYGGAYAVKDLEGNSILKSEGADADEKELAGTNQEKALAADDDQKSRGAGEDNKTRGADSEKKDQAGATLDRNRSGDTINKNESGTAYKKQSSGTESEKQSNGTHDARSASAISEQKSFMGYTLFIKCRKEDSTFSLKDFFGKGKIQLYDINGLREITISNIKYE